MTRVFSITTLCLVFHWSFITKTVSNKEGKQDFPTKLCGDPKCEVTLFSSKFTREYSPAEGVMMLTAKENDEVNVVAIKFSNRPDFFEAKKGDARGLIYKQHIDGKPFIQFLESALKNNLTLFVVEQDTKKFIREINAFPELIKDYTVYVKEIKDYQVDKDLFEKVALLDGGIKKQEPKEKIIASSETTENPNTLNTLDDEKQKLNENVEKKNNVEESIEDVNKNPSVPLEVSNQNLKSNEEIKKNQQEQTDLNENQQSTSVENQIKINENQIDETKGKKVFNGKLMFSRRMKVKTFQENQKIDANIVTASNDSEPAKSEGNKEGDINTQQQLTDEQVTEQPQIHLPTTIQPPISNEQPSEHSQQQPILNSSVSIDPPLSLPSIAPEFVPITSPEVPIVQKDQTKDGVGEATTMSPPPVFQNQSLNQAAATEEKSLESTNSLNKKEDEKPQINDGKHEGKSEEIPVLKKGGLEQQNMMAEDTKSSVLSKQPEVPEKKIEQPMENIPKMNEQQKSSELPPPPTNEQKSGIDNIKIENKDDVYTQIKNNIENVNQQNSPPPPLPPYSPPPSPPVPNIPIPPIEVVQQNIELHNNPPTDEKQQQATTATPGDHNNIGDLKEESSKEDSPKADIGQQQQTVPKADMGQQQNDSIKDMQEQKTLPEDKSDYCYKDDCKKLDNIPSDTEKSPFDSKIRKMFRETMASIKGLLPEPLCYFEDTGLIIIAFVLISILLHLTNMLFSKSVGPDPFDHRLLHDCITRLKEQEVIIEQMNANAADNQRLREIANNAEQLQRENNILEERIHIADEEISEFKKENGELRKSLMSIYHELELSKNSVGEFKKSLDNKEGLLKSTESERQRIEAELDQTLSKLSQTQNREKYLDEDLKEALTKIDKLKIELENSLKELQKWQNEYTEKKAEVDELLEIIAEFNNKNIEKGEKKFNKKNINRGSNDSVSPDSPPEQMVESGELDVDNGAGSGGSAGWSDLGDGIEIAGNDSEPKVGEKSPPKQKKSLTKEEQISEEIVGEENVKEKKKESEDKNSTKLVDILEMAKLKGKLRSLETERGQLKFSLKIEKEEKENLQKELDRLRQEIVEKERDSEQRELDRHGLTQQCSKLLQMIEEKEKKVEYSENERERLRSRLSEIELELRRVEDERRELVHKHKELEQSLKRSNELNGKLENKLFHEERKMNAKIRQLEEQLITAKSSLSPLNLSAGGGVSSDLNMSGNSSDRDFIPLNGPEGGDEGGGQVERSMVPSLWSEIEASEPADELVNLERKASMRRRRSAARESPFLGDIVHISSSGREERFNTSKYSSVSSTAAPRQRMRSRSAGRQSARLTGVSATNPLYNTTSSIGASTTSLNRQRASVLPTGKSSPYRNMIERPASTRPRNNLYTTTSAGAMSGGAYSSDSNGASSPPPEMPLLSGVPPPGLNKRPAIILPQRMQVHLHKPANILPK
uniref:Transport and Golgi organization protein 1 n=1 Tax=Meloidogyne floridensis TaxID=298350 RepID=A0A915NXH9_9BILA